MSDRDDSAYQAIYEMGARLASDLLRDLDLALLHKDDGTPQRRDQLLGVKILAISGAIDTLQRANEDLESE